MKNIYTATLCGLLFIFFFSCAKTNEEVIKSVSLSHVTAELFEGDVLQLDVLIFPSNLTGVIVEWTSSNQSVASVSSTGTVTAISEGVATISASVNEKTGSCIVNVSKKNVAATSIEISETSLELIESQTATLYATISPPNAIDKTINWSTSDASVATVENGKVTAISKGIATITASSNDGSGKHSSCTVNVIRLVSSIVIEESSINVYTGEYFSIKAKVLPEDASNTEITWSSSDPSIADISSNTGIITGISRGFATITVTANDSSGVCASCEVEVMQHVTNITLNKYSLALKAGNLAELTVTGVYPDNANDKSFSWYSTNEAVASVNAAGEIVALNGGNAIIKAIANDGSEVYASCNVGVAVDLGLSVLWAPSNLSSNGLVGAPEEYGEFYAWGETTPKNNYDWTTYKWCDGTETTLTKYNSYSAYGIVDNRIVLNSEDDAASQTLGSNWRMPTFSEFEELYNNCTISWVRQNGIFGRLFTSTIDGYKDRSIFLPAAGFSGGTVFNGPVGINSTGRYWSSSVYQGYPHTAYALDFDSSKAAWVYGNYFAGFSIRPILE